MLRAIAFAMLVFVAGTGTCFADPSADADKDKPREINVPDELAKTDSGTTKMNPQLVNFVGWSCVGIGVGVILLCAGAARLLELGKLSQEIFFRLAGLIVIVGVGAFILIAGYGPNQSASFMGILGSALGYLFAKDWGKEKEVKP